MCLGIPGKILEIYEVDRTLMAKVDFEGVLQEVCIATTPEAQIGQYVLVHAGFALNLLSDQEADETLKILKDLEAFNQEFYGDGNSA
ncbi:MAG TPA: HypC/HybG/HupF family hydrogenase formation chaperone [Chloroflexi bacterium]|jgi:hydrogenase expression/formation protein HypC|nr:HypC/HybG/HupF family hydrogenase formation chaperone [Anaerolineaceae bacterium]HHX09548.1 HypC/HybG/HupF family hydrogenase formation chaperone [Chloroflexota bacterium]